MFNSTLCCAVQWKDGKKPWDDWEGSVKNIVKSLQYVSLMPIIVLATLRLSRMDMIYKLWQEVALLQGADPPFVFFIFKKLWKKKLQNGIDLKLLPISKHML